MQTRPPFTVTQRIFLTLEKEEVNDMPALFTQSIRLERGRCGAPVEPLLASVDKIKCSACICACFFPFFFSICPFFQTKPQ